MTDEQRGVVRAFNDYVTHAPGAQGKPRLYDNATRMIELVATLDTERASALDALQRLHDAQNGPPLHSPSAEAFWNDAMERARVALAGTATTGDGWIKCADRMPPIGLVVIIAFAPQPGVTFSPSFAAWGGQGWDHDNWNSECGRERVTHWQPLPLPPVAVGEKSGH